MAARQQASNQGVLGYQQQAGQILGQRASLAQAAQQGDIAATGQRGDIMRSDAAFGATSAGAVIDSGAGGRDAFLRAEGVQEGSQLGSDMATEQARQAYEKDNTPQAKFKRSIDPGGILLK